MYNLRGKQGEAEMQWMYYMRDVIKKKKSFKAYYRELNNNTCKKKHFFDIKLI